MVVGYTGAKGAEGFDLCAQERKNDWIMTEPEGCAREK